ncbi:hypothetical protein OsJ_35835 [Oryza sativa Japonica Group]|uniref:Uncharacterized protein n=1 Tax=Oryza sativa subsp. japonica TaxID=39947 RepID=A3CGM1_ORYSJ|nr:hypothetical protein OsJ_35835 [Oryza sativa Japonica Group]
MDSGGGGGASHKAASGSAPSGAAAANPTAMLSALMSKRAKLQEELRSIERQVGGPPVHATVAVPARHGPTLPWAVLPKTGTARPITVAVPSAGPSYAGPGRPFGLLLIMGNIVNLS